jgi:hypothetical protein
MGRYYTFQLVELVDSDLRRMSALVRQYADLRLGGTDASVVAICERLRITARSWRGFRAALPPSCARIRCLHC